jgi:hypothetical protein
MLIYDDTLMVIVDYIIYDSYISYRHRFVSFLHCIIYEDNVVCVAQMKSNYIKSNVTKHITHNTT